MSWTCYGMRRPSLSLYLLVPQDFCCLSSVLGSMIDRPGPWPDGFPPIWALLFFHLFSVSFGERSSTCPVCAVLEPPNTVLCRGSTSKTCFVSRPLPAGVFCAVLRKLEQLFVRTLCAQTGAVAGMRHLCLPKADFGTKPLARF